MQRRILYAMLALILTSLALLPARSAGAATDPATASTNAYNWLKSRMIAATGLVDSYLDRQDICYTYDEAVAAIAFLVKNDTANAKKVLDALKSMQYADGSWNTAYYCKTKGVKETTKQVGPVMWIALAVANYEKRTNDTTTYHNMAQQGITWALQFQQADGGINGGNDYDGSLLTWCSTEHNEDAYAVLTYFGQTTAASRVKSFLDTAVWEDTTGHFYGGRGDTRDPLDVNPWGVSTLGLSGTHTYSRGLDYAMTHHRTTQSARIGTTTITVDAFDFNSDRNDIWFEGSGQMAEAFKVAGRTSDANYFIGEIIKAQQSDGGVPYSLKGTNNGYWMMATSESVSSTGWLIFAIEGVNPFKP